MPIPRSMMSRPATRFSYLALLIRPNRYGGSRSSRGATRTGTAWSPRSEESVGVSLTGPSPPTPRPSRCRRNFSSSSSRSSSRGCWAALASANCSRRGRVLGSRGSSATRRCTSARLLVHHRPRVPVGQRLLQLPPHVVELHGLGRDAGGELDQVVRAVGLHRVADVAGVVQIERDRLERLGQPLLLAAEGGHLAAERRGPPERAHVAGHGLEALAGARGGSGRRRRARGSAARCAAPRTFSPYCRLNARSSTSSVIWPSTSAATSLRRWALVRIARSNSASVTSCWRRNCREQRNRVAGRRGRSGPATGSSPAPPAAPRRCPRASDTVTPASAASRSTASDLRQREQQVQPVGSRSAARPAPRGRSRPRRSSPRVGPTGRGGHQAGEREGGASGGHARSLVRPPPDRRCPAHPPPATPPRGVAGGGWSSKGAVPRRGRCR